MPKFSDFIKTDPSWQGLVKEIKKNEELISKQNNKARLINKDLERIKKEFNKFYINIIEVMTIFVAIISFIFSSINFVNNKNLNFDQILLLLIISFVFTVVSIVTIHYVIRLK